LCKTDHPDMPNIFTYDMPNIFTYDMPNIFTYDMPNIFTYDMPNIFTYDMFKKSNYNGIVSINNKPTFQWTNTDFLGINGTYYQDAITFDPIQFSPHKNPHNITFIFSFSNASSIDRYLTISQDLMQICKA